MVARRHKDLEQIIGLFSNIIALKNYPKAGQAFTEFLKNIKENTLMAYENQEYPFMELAKKVSANKSISRNSLFDVMFFWDDSFQKTAKQMREEVAGVKIEPYKYKRSISKVDMTLTGIDSKEGLLFRIEYSTELFKKETMEKFIKYFQDIVRVLTNNKNIKLKDIQAYHSLVVANPDNLKQDDKEEGFRLY
jgi:non-ribosomal peptide synthetase component F